MNRPNFSQRLNDFPPILCRLLAHEKNSPLTAEEIAERSTQTPGVNSPLNPVQVETISKSLNWNCIPILDALAFMYGCRVDLTDAKVFRRVKDYLHKKPNFEYLRLSPDWKAYYCPLLIRWRKSYGEKVPNTVSPPVKKLLERLTPMLNTVSYRHASRQKDILPKRIMSSMEPDQEFEPIKPLPDNSLNDTGKIG